MKYVILSIAPFLLFGLSLATPRIVNAESPSRLGPVTTFQSPSGLVSRWTGDGNADDLVGGNNGSLVDGATYTAGILGPAFFFDGIGAYMQAPTVGLPTGNADRTLTMWIRIDATVASESFFGGYGNFGEFTHTFAVGSTGPNNTLFFSQWGGGMSGPQLQVGRWYHVAVTNNGNKADLYLDGIPSATTIVQISTSSGSQFYVGRIPGPLGNVRRLQGAVDDVRVYDRTLTPLEIEQIFNERTVSHTPFDFDGDGKTDIGIFRLGAAEWWVNRSGDGQTFALQFGASTDRIVPADYTGDGRSEIAVWRPATGEWFILRSEDFSYFAFPFGRTGDIPAPADYDGDGRADAAVFRQSDGTWYVSRSIDGGTRIEQFGSTNDVPVPSDYDGDGRADVAIFRPDAREWWVDRSTAGVLALQFGDSTDKPVEGDYTGDGKFDVAMWRPSTGEWFILRSEDNSYFSFPFGTVGDVPSPGDYDGDGKCDLAVFRPSNATWFIERSFAGTRIVQFGVTGDRPIPSAFLR